MNPRAHAAVPGARAGRVTRVAVRPVAAPRSRAARIARRAMHAYAVHVLVVLPAAVRDRRRSGDPRDGARMRRACHPRPSRRRAGSQRQRGQYDDDRLPDQWDAFPELRPDGQACTGLNGPSERCPEATWPLEHALRIGRARVGTSSRVARLPASSGLNSRAALPDLGACGHRHRLRRDRLARTSSPRGGRRHEKPRLPVCGTGRLSSIGRRSSQ